MTDLKPCPFCGGKASIYEEIPGGYIVQCHDCCGQIGIMTREHVIAAWNARVDTEYGSVPATDENMAKHGWVRERTCKPCGEWERISQTQEIRHIYCECGEYFGADERDSFPFAIETKAYLPNYCPNCGAKIIEEKGKGNDGE